MRANFYYEETRLPLIFYFHRALLLAGSTLNGKFDLDYKYCCIIENCVRTKYFLGTVKPFERSGIWLSKLL